MLRGDFYTKDSDSEKERRERERERKREMARERKRKRGREREREREGGREVRVGIERKMEIRKESTLITCMRH